MTMEQSVIDLYYEYTHTPLPRRVFLDKLARLAGSGVAAMTLLPLLEPATTSAAVAQDDERLTTSYVDYPGKTGEVRAYSARPRGETRLPGIVVIHENRGLNPHIEDVARRAALGGFSVLAPNALSPVGGTPDDTDLARSRMRELEPVSTRENFAAAVTYLKKHPQSTGKVGCVGFCWGGGMSNQLAVHAPDLSAAVVFYGRSPAVEDVPQIKVPLLRHYAGLDERINKTIPEFEKALKSNGVTYQVHMYDGAKHAFHNDTSDRYDEGAAKSAWKRTMAFFNETLKE